MAEIRKVVIKTGFKDIKCDFLRDSTVRKGKNLLESNHVFDVEESEGVIKGKVIRQTSVNAAPYTVSIQLTEERVVNKSECECLAGISGACKHIAAVVLYVNSEETISKTSLPQSWGIPSGARKDKYKKGKKIIDLFPPKIPTVDLTIPEVETEGLDLQGLLETCPLNQMTNYEKMDEAQVASRGIFHDVVESFVESRSSRFISRLVDNQDSFVVYSNYLSVNMNDEQAAIYNSDIFLTRKEIETTCITTLDQSGSPHWFKERSRRVSASVGHKIFRRRNLSSKFIEVLYNKPSFKSKATTHGLMNEHIAFREVSELAKAKLVNSGLCIHHEQPWICGSPDGIFIDHDDEPFMVLEIKCPYNVRNKGVVDECDERPTVPYILKDENTNEFMLKKNHMYYTQVQLLMYVTGLSKCLFYVYTPVNSLYIIVDRDEDFIEKCVKNLESAYFNFILPAYIDKLKQQSE